MELVGPETEKNNTWAPTPVPPFLTGPPFPVNPCHLPPGVQVALDVDRDTFDKFTLRHWIDQILMELWKVGGMCYVGGMREQYVRG